MSLYNEEKVIIEKLNTLITQEYPTEKLHIYIGSDCSSDNTNALVHSFIKKHQLTHFHFLPNKTRQGKPSVINQLYQKAISHIPKGKEHIIIVTDASVLLSPQVVFSLAKHFENEKIGLVDSWMQHTGIQAEGISKSEDQYISKEVQIKHYESLWNKKMMGPFGGCYAIRSDVFTPVPKNYLVDDFFLAMNVLQLGYDAINERQAVCYEVVSQEIKEEYRRKKRISAGNFQNLAHYKHLLLSKQKGLAFNLWSHKVIRWLGPFLIAICYITNCILIMWGNLFDITLLFFQTILIFIIPILDGILEKGRIHIPLFRSIRYFFIMNLALLEGFFRYLKGIQSNVWQPTQRPDSTQ